MSFDALTHLDFPRLEASLSQIALRAKDAGVLGWAIAGTSPVHWERVLRISKETMGTPLLGIHPWWAHEVPPQDITHHLDQLGRLSIHGVGEIGLDYARAKDEQARDHQKNLFREQLAFARSHDLPVAIHCVRAHSDLLHILKQDGVPSAGGLMHGWGGGPQFIPVALQLGLHISFGPSVWNVKYKRTRESVPLVPIDRLCFETDSPDYPRPGQTFGEPGDLIAVARALASIRGCAIEALWDTCGGNARSLWRVDG